MMNVRFRLLFCVLLAMGVLPSFAAEEFVLAKDGQSAARIVLLPDSGPVVAKSVADLFSILTKMTGATFEKSEDSKVTPAVVIGLASEWAKISQDDNPVKALAEAAPESFLLRSSPERLLILGRDREGISHGIYSVLRDLGCRWYFLTDDWEVIPEKKDVLVSVDRIEGPAFKMRVLSNGAGAGPSRQMLEDWSRRNRLGSSYGPKTVHHSYASYVPNTLFKTRPELFAWVSKDGESKGTFQNGLQPCTTNPEVVKMFIDGALENLRQKKNLTGEALPLISVSPNDGTGDMCRCELCMETGNYGDCALLLANQVAEAIHGEFPDTIVGFLAYGRPSAIPEKIKEAHPSVMAGIATNFNWKNSVQRLLQEWPEIVQQSIVREYYAIMKWGSPRPDNTMPNVDYLSQSLRSWEGKGIDGINGEMANDWAPCGLRFWAFSELSWDPSLKPEAVREDFYQKAWGEAVEPMRRYFERWESGQMASQRTLRLAMQDLDEAARLAKTPEIAERVDQMSIYLYWHLLKEAYKSENDEEAKNQIALEGDMLQYRWRNAFMVQLPPAIFGVHRTAPMGFTREEVADLRAKALERFLPKVGPDIDLMSGYSFDLVAWKEGLSVKESTTEEDLSRAFTTASYVVRAKAGEKIEVVFTADPSVPVEPPKAAARREEADPMDDPEGAEVLPSGQATRLQIWWLGPEGREQDFLEEALPQISVAEPFKFTFEAPQDGLYRINAQVMNKHGRVMANFQGRPQVLAAHLNRRKDFLPLAKSVRRKTSDEVDSNEVTTNAYFFVPPGTKAFVVRAVRNYQRKPVAVTFSTAEGEFIEEVNSEYQTETLVQVPPGRDGAVWNLRTEGELETLALDGVPPWLASDPAQLLVPREFAPTAAPR